MVKVVFDTNILIDYLKGEPKALAEVDAFAIKCVSIISYIEVLVGVDSKDVPLLQQVQEWLLTFELLSIDMEIADLSINLRQRYKIKVPDALVLATAQRHGAVLSTRNTKDFSQKMPFVRIPYILT